MTNRPFIPVCEPCFSGNELAYVSDAITSGWVSSAGFYIDRFESEFASYCGTKHGISTTSGTTALHLALLALDISQDDEVIIPDFTMAAVLCAVLYRKATPIFIDAEIDTWNIDTAQIEKKISSRTRAIIVVHTYGHPVNMEPIWKLAKKHNLYVIEDAAEAHSAQYNETMCGNLGDIACFSFYGNKIITTGEGGMVTTSDDELAKRCRYYKNLCFPINGQRDYVHDHVGYNYRMTNIQAALGLAQLEKIDELAKHRIENATLYNKRLGQITGIQIPVEKSYAKNVYWMYGIVIDKNKYGVSRDELMRKLDVAGIGSRLFFKPLHSQKMLEELAQPESNEYPISKHLAENGLYLPSSSKLTQDDISYICDTIESSRNI